MQNPNNMGIFQLAKAAYAKKHGLTDDYNQQMAAARIAPAVESYMMGQQQQPSQEQIQGFQDHYFKQNLSPEMYNNWKNDKELDEQSYAVQQKFYEARDHYGAPSDPNGFRADLPEPNHVDRAGLLSEFQELAPKLDKTNTKLVQGLLGVGTNTGYGQFKDYDQFLKAQSALRKDANAQLAPTRESLRKFNQATNLVNKRKGFSKMSGADDTVLIKAFASMILPGEAVMEGDIGAIVNQSGVPGWLKSFIQKVQGKGQLDETERMKIYDTMTNLAKAASNENQEIRAQYRPDVESSGFNPSSVYRPSLSFNPYTIKAPSVQPINNQSINKQSIDSLVDHYTKGVK